MPRGQRGPRRHWDACLGSHLSPGCFLCHSLAPSILSSHYQLPGRESLRRGTRGHIPVPAAPARCLECTGASKREGRVLLAPPYSPLPPHPHLSVLPGLCSLGEAPKGGVLARHSREGPLPLRWVCDNCPLGLRMLQEPLPFPSPLLRGATQMQLRTHFVKHRASVTDTPLGSPGWGWKHVRWDLGAGCVPPGRVGPSPEAQG